VHDTFHRDKASWSNLTFNSEKSPLAKKEYIQRIARKYGIDSDVYRVRVLGTEPKGNPKAFISMESATKARYREGVLKEGRLSIGCDPARFGSDSTVTTLVKGNYVYPQKRKGQTDTDMICDMVLTQLREYRHETNDYKTICDVNIDATGGYGAGAIDQLRKNTTDNIRVNAINFTGKINDPEYSDGVSKMYGEVRDRIDSLKLPDDDDLSDELTSRDYGIDSNGKIKIKSKEEFRKEHGASPDRADSLVLAVSRETAFKKVFEYFNINEHIKPFTINFDQLQPTSTLIISQWVEKSMKSNILVGLWNAARASLYVFTEMEFNNSLPEIVITQLAKKVKTFSNEQVPNLTKMEWFGNEIMVKDNVDSMQLGYRKYGHYVRINTAFEENGAILLTNRLFFRKGLIIHGECAELANQVSAWVVDGTERPAEGYGLARALISMVSSLHEYGKMAKPEKLMEPYSVKKNDWITDQMRQIRESENEPTAKSRYDCDW
jgi:hypothetical protein